LENQETLNITTLIYIGSFGMISLVSFIIMFVSLYQKKMLSHQAIIKENETEFQKQLLDATIEVAEEERKKIASNIHDDVGLTLNVLKLNFSKIKRNIDDKKLLNELIDSNIKIIEETSSVLRGISHELMPPTLSILGLEKGLKELCRQITSSGQIEINAEISNKTIQIDKKKELQLYRIVKELINNIIKHSKSTQVNIKTELNDTILFIEITYNGVGISNEDVNYLIGAGKGIGLKSIQSRVQLTNSKLNYIYKPNELAKIEIKTALYGK
jgi:signal transduction histidine kinase